MSQTMICPLIILSLTISTYGISIKRQALSSITERGCIYVAHYVRDNYYDYVPERRQVTLAPTTPMVSSTAIPLDTTTHLNWVQMVYDTMRKDYVPMELFKALMNCGKEYSLFAIDASNDLKTTFNVDFGAVPGLG